MPKVQQKQKNKITNRDTLDIFRCQKNESNGWYTMEGDTKKWDEKKVKQFWKQIREKKMAKKDFDFSGFVFPKFELEIFGTTNKTEEEILLSIQEIIEGKTSVSTHTSPAIQVERNFGVQGEPDRFLGYTTFDDAVFLDISSFEGAVFLNEASFLLTVFTGRADFYGAEFSRGVNFHEAVFSNEANFSSAAFLGSTNFDGAIFLGTSSFELANFSGHDSVTGSANFYQVKFLNDVSFSHANFAKEVSFVKVTFSGTANYNNVTFSSVADFENSTFFKEAKFSNLKYNLKTTFINFFSLNFKEQGKLIYENIEDSCLMRFGGDIPSSTIFRNIHFGRTFFDNTHIETVQFYECDWCNIGGRNGIYNELNLHKRLEYIAKTKDSRLKDPAYVAKSDEEKLQEFRQLAKTDENEFNKKIAHLEGSDEHTSRELIRLANSHEDGEFLCKLINIDEEELRDVNPLIKKYEEIENTYCQLKNKLESISRWQIAGNFHIGEMEMRRKRLFLESKWFEWLLLIIYRVISFYGESAGRACWWMVGLVISGAIALALTGISLEEAFLKSLQTVSFLQDAMKEESSQISPVTDGLSLSGKYIIVALRICSPIVLGLFLLAVKRKLKR